LSNFILSDFKGGLQRGWGWWCNT